jgi:hypothetical protein
MMNTTTINTRDEAAQSKHAAQHPVSYRMSDSSASAYDVALKEPYNSVMSEQALWRAVIAQALMDASSNSKKQENLQAKEEALI